MADPLSVLRDFATAGRADQVATRPDGRVYFADQYSFPKATLTAFKSGGGGGFYDLEAVVYYIKLTAANETARLGEYVAGCKKFGIRTVPLVDRKVRGWGWGDGWGAGSWGGVGGV